MKFLKPFTELRPFTQGQLRGLLALLFLQSGASGATLVWDIDPSTAGSQDGNGTWNSTNTHWWNELTQTNVAYDAVGPPTLEFHGGGNPASSVTLVGPSFAVAGLTFRSETLPLNYGNSHSFLGTSTLELAEGAIVDVGTNARVNFAGTIGVNAAHGFTKTGNGVLILRKINGVVGESVVDGGSLDVYGSAKFSKITFKGSSALITHSGNDLSFQELIWESSANSPLAAIGIDSTFTIGSGGLWLRNGGLNLSANTHTSTLKLEGNVTFDGSLATTFNLGLGGTGTAQQKLIDLAGGNRTFSVEAGKTLRIQPIIQNGALSKSGAGTLELRAANTYAGGTTIHEGRLLLSESGSVGNANAVLSVAEAGTFDLGGTNQTLAQLTGAGVLQNTRSSSATNTLTLASDTLNSQWTGRIQDVGSNGKLALVKSGDATLSLSGANTYTGGTTLAGGILEITNTDAHEVSSNNYLAKTLGTGQLTLKNGTLKIRVNGLSNNATQQLRYDNVARLEGDVTFDLARQSGTGTGKQVRFHNLTVTQGGHTITTHTDHNYSASFSSIILEDHLIVNTQTVGNVSGGGLIVSGAIQGADFDVTKRGTGALVFTGGTFRDMIVDQGKIDFFSVVNHRNVHVNGNAQFTTHSGNTWNVKTLNYDSTSVSSNFYSASGISTFNFDTINLSRGGIRWQTDSRTVATDRIQVVLKNQLNVTGNASFLSDGAGLGQKILDFNGGERQIHVAEGVTFTNQIGMENGGFVKVGEGKMIVTATSLYEGDTRVEAGTLEVNSLSGSGTGSGAVQVSNATLSGIGLLAPSAGKQVTLGLNAVLAPGSTAAPIGSLVIDGDATFLAGSSSSERSTLRLEMGGTEAGDFDRLLVQGALDFGAQVELVFVNGVTGSELSEGDQFDFLDWGSANFQNFESMNFFDLPDLSAFGLAWNTSFFSTDGTLRVGMVPEPHRAILIVLGMASLSALYRKRKHA